MIFTCDMGDLFYRGVPDDIVASVILAMEAAPWHTYLILTKRIDRAADFLHGTKDTRGHYDGLGGCPDKLPVNWFVGTSIEDQPSANARAKDLLRIRGNTFFSIEPMLGPIDMVEAGYIIQDYAGDSTVPAGMKTILNARIDGVIVGGESGPGARPMHPAWPRRLRDDCKEAGIPFMFKQWGDWSHGYAGDPPDAPSEIVNAEISNYAGWCKMWRTGKKRAGRLLDEQEHNDLAWSAQMKEHAHGNAKREQDTQTAD